MVRASLANFTSIHNLSIYSHTTTSRNAPQRMFRPTRTLSQAIALTSDLLKSHLPQKWFGERANVHIGLAISGGVDSMALATLCSRLCKEHRNRAPTFTGFIVDHGLRAGSRQEALLVAKYLRDMDMPSQIFTLDWKLHGDPATILNPETLARKLRYRALGQACRDRGIPSLLFAHHADDQAETTLMRLANKYLGRGLAGMQREAHIPECEAMWGVDLSGILRALSCPFEESMLVESGGVNVLRPLLGFTKARLVATCEEAGAKWVEDQTNKDPSLTLRNTVRQLHEGDRLPKALQRPNLCAIADRTRKRMTEREEEARRFFERLNIQLEPRSGSAICKIPDEVVEEVNGLSDSEHIKVLLLRMLLLLVAPTRKMDLATLERAARHFLPREGTNSHPTLACSGAAITRLKKPAITHWPKLPQDRVTKYEIRRTAPIKAAKKPWPRLEWDISPSHLNSDPASSEWQLWDSRYWIRICPTGQHMTAKRVVARFLTDEDISQLYEELRHDKQQTKELHERLSVVKGHMRNTLPAIELFRSSGDGLGVPRPEIVALPSLSWWRDASESVVDAIPSTTPGSSERTGFDIGIRYKHVDDSLTRPVESEGNV